MCGSIRPSLIVSLAVQLAGCAGTSNAGGENVAFEWTFAGNHCAQVPGVSGVRLAIPGKQLRDGGLYPCTTNNVDAVVLPNFEAGTYSYTINGLAQDGSVLYAKTGGFIVTGSTSVAVDLEPAVATVPYHLKWALGDYNLSCDSQPKVDTVEVEIDNNFLGKFSCSDGQTGDGIGVNLAVGTHKLCLVARGRDLAAPQGQSRDMQYYGVCTPYSAIPGGQTTPISIKPAVGGVALKWSFMGRTCAEAGVSTVYVNFQLWGGRETFPDTSGTGIPVPCTDNGSDGVVLPSPTLSYTPLGTWVILLSAEGRGQFFRSGRDLGQSPSVSVVPGVYPSIVNAQNVLLQ